MLSLMIKRPQSPGPFGRLRVFRSVTLTKLLQQFFDSVSKTVGDFTSEPLKVLLLQLISPARKANLARYSAAVQYD